MTLAELAQKTGRSTDFIEEKLNGLTWYDGKGKMHTVTPQLVRGLHYRIVGTTIEFLDAAVEFIRNAPRSATFGKVA